MTSLFDEWKSRFESVWDIDGQGQYRLGSPGLRLVPRFIELVPQNVTVNEYGSGTGRAVAEIRRVRPDLKINMVDIAENALEPTAAGMIGPDVTLTIAPLWGLPNDFPVAEWGYCIDVLMCVPPQCLNDIMAEIRRTCKNLFAQVYDWSDVRLGIDYTSVKQNFEWWLEKFQQYWPTVSSLPSAEHARRYIFLCRGEE